MTYTELEKRMGTRAAYNRLCIEHAQGPHARKQRKRTRLSIKLKNHLYYLAMKLLGIQRKGRIRALNLRVIENTVFLPNLPTAFDGFTLLHLSDLHLEMLPELTDRIISSIQPCQYDLCILTGDFTEGSFESTSVALEGVRRICAEIPTPILGVLGNHDSSVMVPKLEEMGMQILLNEAVPIKKEGEHIFCVGVDDPHRYRSDDLNHALKTVPERVCKILLAHTAEIYKEAAVAGIDLYLCGHTHGGQICLPGSIPVFTNVRAPRRMSRGKWHYEKMAGYTSVGAGVSTAANRINCPPEITLHHLRCAQCATTKTCAQTDQLMEGAV